MNGTSSLPRGMSFGHPVCLISTWFGCGLLPWAPGSWGSLGAVPLAVLVHYYGGGPGLVFVALVLFLIGLWTADIYTRRTRERDPGAIVIDEVAGQILVLSVVPPDWGWYLAGFVLFRIMDVLKPWPVSWMERRFDGGFGVMVDDIGAALYAMAVLYGISWVLG